MLEQTKKRYIEFDVLRAFAILLLPLIHLYEEMNDQGVLTSAAVQSQRWILYLCVYAPSIFMLCFGANLFFAGEKTPAEYAKRGLHFLLIGALFSTVRFVLPATIVELFGKKGEIVKAINTVLCCDIYDFVGIFLLLYALLKKLKLSDFTMLMITLLMLFANSCLSKVSTGSAWLDSFLGRFFYVNKDSCFPLLSWSIFPMLGVYVGKIYRYIQGEKQGQILLKCLIASLVADLVLYVTLYTHGLNYFKIAATVSNDYKTDFISVIVLVLIFAKLLPIAYLISSRFEKSRPVQWLCSLSSVIMSFYVIHWIIVGWLEYILANSALRGKMTVGIFYAIYAGLMISSLVLTKLFGKKLQKILK